MVELMNFFVAMTKESHLCHVIIASSDAFFIEQIYVDSKLRKTSEFMKLDYLKKKDVLFWLRDIKKHNNVTEYTLNEEQIEIIWQTVGGSTWEIYSILSQLFISPLETIVAKIKREQVAMIFDVIRRGRNKEAILKKFVNTPIVSAQQFALATDQLLGELVRDNILYYDPVEGLYGVQGKSLELGINDYFATS
jgi:AAA+ ATPase superfamily predicted ATPase